MRHILAGALALLLFFTSVADAVAPTQFVVDPSYFHPVVQDFQISFDPNPTQAIIGQSTPIVTHLTLTDPKKYALIRVGPEQFSCLDKLWTRESHWNPLDRNSRSGAYGIPQALPGSKMAIIGTDWRTNPITQVRWGLYYIKYRYGTPCQAWKHSQVYNWY